MNARQDRILKLLLERGRLSVEELAEHGGVSGMTVRRDLQVLEADGLLTRTHGGCVLQSGQVREQPFQEKAQQNRAAKAAIARAVAARLANGQSVYLDTGTTCAAVARLLPGHRHGMHVFSNNLPAVLDLFGAPDITVTVPGGVLGRRSPDLCGDAGIGVVNRVCFDVAIVGADALDPASGEYYAADLATAALSAAAQQRADRTFVCIDRTKFGRRAMAVAGRLGPGSVLFTDADLPATRIRQWKREDIEVVTLKEEQE